MDFESILREAGANVRPQDDESHRPEVMNILLAIPDQIIGMTIPEMVASAWPTDSLMADYAMNVVGDACRTSP